MSNVINRTTLIYLASVNEPDYPQTEWIWSPVLPTCDSKYWKIVGDNVLEMSTSEKTIKDAWIEEQKRYDIKPKTQIMSELWANMTSERETRWQNAIMTPSFQMMSLQLDGNDYIQARTRGQELVTIGVINQDDYNILDGILPQVMG